MSHHDLTIPSMWSRSRGEVGTVLSGQKYVTSRINAYNIINNPLSNVPVKFYKEILKSVQNEKHMDEKNPPPSN